MLVTRCSPARHRNLCASHGASHVCPPLSPVAPQPRDDPMTTGTMKQVGSRERLTDVLTDLRAAHLEAAATVAELDLDDAALWRQADGVVAAVSAASYDLAAVMTGGRPGRTATGVRPIVRVRELAVAQRGMLAVLDRHPTADEELLDQASQQVGLIGLLLQSLAPSTPRSRPIRGAGDGADDTAARPARDRG